MVIKVVIAHTLIVRIITARSGKIGHYAVGAMTAVMIKHLATWCSQRFQGSISILNQEASGPVYLVIPQIAVVIKSTDPLRTIGDEDGH